MVDLIKALGEQAQPVRLELLDATTRYQLPRFDQTLTPMGESAIEIIVRKRLPAEVLAKGRLPNADKQLTSEGFTLLTGYKAHG